MTYPALTLDIGAERSALRAGARVVAYLPAAAPLTAAGARLLYDAFLRRGEATLTSEEALAVLGGVGRPRLIGTPAGGSGDPADSTERLK